MLHISHIPYFERVNIANAHILHHSMPESHISLTIVLSVSKQSINSATFSVMSNFFYRPDDHEEKIHNGDLRRFVSSCAFLCTSDTALILCTELKGDWHAIFNNVNPDCTVERYAAKFYQLELSPLWLVIPLKHIQLMLFNGVECER